MNRMLMHRFGMAKVILDLGRVYVKFQRARNDPK